MSNYAELPVNEVDKLLSKQYRKTTLPRKLAFKNLRFAKPIFRQIHNDLKDLLYHRRKDARKRIKTAFRLILANLVLCTYTREALSIAGGKRAYASGSYLNKFYLTLKATSIVLNALVDKGYVIKEQGNTYSEEVNKYIPTYKLEQLLINLMYSVVEEYDDKCSYININRPKVDKGEVNTYTQLQVEIDNSTRYYVYPFDETHTKAITLDENHNDISRLKRLNQALSEATYAFKSPLWRIYCNNDINQGGRIYCTTQTLPDKKARIRINTQINGIQVAEVDLSCNHAAMLLAFDKKQINVDFYTDIANSAFVSRDKVKFLVTRFIGASDKSVDLRESTAIEEGWELDKLPTHTEKDRVLEVIEEKYPDLSLHFFQGRGVFLQVLEGNILLNAMCTLLDQGILSIPVHDALCVQYPHIEQARKALEDCWMSEFEVSFKPHTKIDYSDQLEHLKLAA